MVNYYIKLFGMSRGCMETYDRILKFKDSGDCSTCYFFNECQEIHKPGPSMCSRRVKKHVEKLIEKHMWHYANTKQLKGLIEEAEAGAHEWVRENTLFVCDSYDKPNVHCPDRCTQSFPHDFEAYPACGKHIPYRGTKGEPQVFGTYVEYSEVEILSTCGNCRHNIEGVCVMHPNCDSNNSGFEPIITESKDNKDREILRVKAGEMAGDEMEYVVLKDITLKSMSNVDIRPDIFKESVRIFGKYHITVGTTWNLSGHVMGFIDELVRLGFVERKVDKDPVVYTGDTFNSCDPDGPYRIMICGKGSYALCNIDGKSHYGGTVLIPPGEDIRLSMFAGDDLYKFTPCKVTVTEVE